MAAGRDPEARRSHLRTRHGQTLDIIASHYPHAWYHDLLTSFAIPHATAFGVLVEAGETLTGAGLIATPLIAAFAKLDASMWSRPPTTAAALAAGTRTSVNYWFATAWLAPADDTVNMLMAVIQAGPGTGWQGQRARP